MSPTTIPEPLALVSQEFVSHCIVTVKSGTNYSPALHHSQVKTQFSLRFEGAHPLQLKGIKEDGGFVGFELGLTGHCELEQLILALESAAATLRGLSTPPPELPELPEPPADPLRPVSEPVSEPVDRLGMALAQVEARELHVVRLLVLYGEHVLPTGPSVAQHLLTKLRNAPLSGARWAGVWALCAAALLAGTVPTGEGWLARQWVERISPVEGAALVEELLEAQRRYARAEALTVRAGFKREQDRLPLACSQALVQLYLARIGVEKEQLVAEMAVLEGEDEGEGAELSEALTALLLRLQDAGRRENEALTRLGLPTA